MPQSVLDCGDPVLTARRKALYLRVGFMPMPATPLRLYLPVATVRALFGLAKPAPTAET